MTTDLHLFATRSIARARAKALTLEGWPKAKAVALYVGTNGTPVPEVDAHGNTWVVEAAPGRFLGADGQVR